MEQTAELYQVVRAQARLETAAFVERYGRPPARGGRMPRLPERGAVLDVSAVRVSGGGVLGALPGDRADRPADAFFRRGTCEDVSAGGARGAGARGACPAGATARGRGAARRAGGQRAADPSAAARSATAAPARRESPAAVRGRFPTRSSRSAATWAPPSALSGAGSSSGASGRVCRVSDACLRGASAVKNVPCLQTVGKFLRILYKFANRGCNSCIF